MIQRSIDMGSSTAPVRFQPKPDRRNLRARIAFTQRVKEAMLRGGTRPMNADTLSVLLYVRVEVCVRVLAQLAGSGEIARQGEGTYVLRKRVATITPARAELLLPAARAKARA